MKPFLLSLLAGTALFALAGCADQPKTTTTTSTTEQSNWHSTDK
jgi:hypothetical protein